MRYYLKSAPLEFPILGECDSSFYYSKSLKQLYGMYKKEIIHHGNYQEYRKLVL